MPGWDQAQLTLLFPGKTSGKLDQAFASHTAFEGETCALTFLFLDLHKSRAIRQLAGSAFGRAVLISRAHPLWP